MESHFQTSFIPKKPSTSIPGGGVTPLSPLASHHGRNGAGIYMAVAVALLAVSLLSVGGAYAWKSILKSSQASYQKELAESESKFNVDQISLLKAQSAKIQLARQLVANHLAISRIFTVVAQLASENVRFLTMDLTVPAGTQNPFQMAISGYGKSLPSVAFQSDVLNSLEKYGLRAVVKNAIVSDPSLNHDGTVSFGFTAQIDPSSFLYSKSIAQSQAVTPSVPSTPSASSTQSQ